LKPLTAHLTTKHAITQDLCQLFLTRAQTLAIELAAKTLLSEDMVSTETSRQPSTELIARSAERQTLDSLAELSLKLKPVTSPQLSLDRMVSGEQLLMALVV
jgi:hypothetical protein